MKKEMKNVLFVAGAVAVALIVNKLVARATKMPSVTESMASATGNTTYKRLAPGRCQPNKQVECEALCNKYGGQMKDGYCVENGRAIPFNRPPFQSSIFTNRVISRRA